MVDTAAVQDMEDGPESTEAFIAPSDDDVSRENSVTVSGGRAEGQPSDAEPDDVTKMGMLTTAVTRQPLNREILYRILVDCRDERDLQELEDIISAYPEFPDATQNPYKLISILVANHGLSCIERDAAGDEITAERRAGLSEDELDDIIETQSYVTTEIGCRFAEQHDPRARLVKLLSLDPGRYDTYIELLEYLNEQPRSYAEVQSLLAGRPALETVIDGMHQTMQPSVFLDKLERNGAIVWRDGWALTKAGGDYLADLLSRSA